MPRAMWTGTVGFGLVNVPVKMYVAVSEKTVRFKQLAPTGEPIKQQRVDGNGNVVESDQLQRGYELTRGRYVTVTDSELESVLPTKTKMIEIVEFVDVDQIDPMLYASHHYLEADTGGDKAYALLTLAMLGTGKAAIGRFVLRQKEKLVAIRALSSGVMVVSSLNYKDEINDPTPYAADTKLITEAELRMAGQLVQGLAVDQFDHAKYKDEYRERLMPIIEAKAAGESITIDAPAPTPEPATDLMAALEASLAEVQTPLRSDGSIDPAELTQWAQNLP